MAIDRSRIENIRQYMNKHGGIATSDRYLVMIPTPPLLETDSGDRPKQYYDNGKPAGLELLEKRNISKWNKESEGSGLSIVCDSASMPGISYQTSAIQDIGPEKVYPYATSFEDLELSFFCSESMRERVFFDAWFESISLITETNFPKFSFRDDYVTTITIDKLNRRDERAYGLKLIDAYPITMASQELSYVPQANDAFKLSITFNYSRWVYNDVPE